MYTWEEAVITTKGLALLAKLTKGNSLTLIRAEVGAGYVDPDTLKHQTAVADMRQELKFAPQSYPEEGKCAVPVRLYNTDLSTGYQAKQVGVYAMDPDEGEILYLIAQASADDGTDIPSAVDMPSYCAEWTFYMAYGQADGVNVTVDPAYAVTRKEVQSLIDAHAGDKSNPHGVTKEQIGLDKVNNTSDTEKYVAFSQESATSRKVDYALTIRLNGGREEGSDMWNYDGSTSRTVNITPEKIGAIGATESPKYIGCYYQSVGGEEEWFNPPMLVDQEYKTAERWAGKAVYKKLVKFSGTNAGNSEHHYYFIDNASATADLITPIRFEAVVIANDGSSFVFPGYSDYDFEVTSKGSIIYGASSAHPDDEIRATIWYVYM